LNLGRTRNEYRRSAAWQRQQFQSDQIPRGLGRYPDHSFALVAPERAAAAPIDFEALELARVAVDVFFIVSGFLVTRSVLTQPTLVDYGVARVLRLFPALIATCIFIAFLLGPAVTSVPLADYFSDPRPWLYVPLTASLITYSLTLPGVSSMCPRPG
jgi:peptidoglycan/LPS O-acetylase OafA/YrhL